MQNHILIISSSIRAGRQSHRAALFFKNYILEHGLATCEIVDLMACDFPLFDERLKFIENPAEAMKDFSVKVKSADGVIIVTPEYNGGYPASLKNAIDLLYEEWHRKPIAIATASDGSFGGSQVITSLVFTFFKMRALVVPAMHPIQKVQETFGEDGIPTDKDISDKRAHHFVNELLWLINAVKQGG